MRYLYYFKESLSTEEETQEAINFCEEGLAYLTDKGFCIKFYNHNYTADGLGVRINNDGKYFYWSDVKDDIMSFLYRLREEYNFRYKWKNSTVVIGVHWHTDTDISNDKSFGSNSGMGFTIKQLDHTKVMDNDKHLISIDFTIKSKKH